MAGLFSAALLAACGSSSSSESSSASGGGSSSGGAAAGSSPTIQVGSTAKLGQVLTDASGKTLYYFLPEKGGTIACTGGCASTWPPATVSGTPIAGSGITGTLGVVARSDGSSQMTYQQWPLHTYSGDMAAGDTNGQGIAGQWFAATAGLTAAGSTPAAATSTSTSSGYGY